MLKANYQYWSPKIKTQQIRSFRLTWKPPIRGINRRNTVFYSPERADEVYRLQLKFKISKLANCFVLIRITQTNILCYWVLTWSWPGFYCESGGGVVVRAGVRFLDSASCVGWVCWFSSLLWEVFPRVLRFSPLLKNLHSIKFGLYLLQFTVCLNAK